MKEFRMLTGPSVGEEPPPSDEAARIACWVCGDLGLVTTSPTAHGGTNRENIHWCPLCAVVRHQKDGPASGNPLVETGADRRRWQDRNRGREWNWHLGELQGLEFMRSREMQRAYPGAPPELVRAWILGDRLAAPDQPPLASADEGDIPF